MAKWRCKYCRRTINVRRKNHHIETKYHKSKARWFKYCLSIDHLTKRLNEEYKMNMYTENEFNEILDQILTERDELDDAGYFKNLPDELD